MKKFILAAMLLTIIPASASAWHRNHYHSGVTVGFGGGYVAPAPVYYAPAPVYYAPPPVIVEQPIVVEEVQPYDNYVRPSSATRYDQGYCREYQRNVKINGKTQASYGTACQQPDGSWQVVN